MSALATIPSSGNAVGITSWSDTTEYGTPRAGTTTPADPGRYNWLGGKQRATDTTGLLLMGARLYNPITGRFTSTDPIPGGNENVNNYPNDPLNSYDLDGLKAAWGSFGSGGIAWAGAATVAVVTVGARRHPPRSYEGRRYR